MSSAAQNFTNELSLGLEEGMIDGSEWQICMPMGQWIGTDGEMG